MVGLSLTEGPSPSSNQGIRSAPGMKLQSLTRPVSGSYSIMTREFTLLGEPEPWGLASTLPALPATARPGFQPCPSGVPIGDPPARTAQVGRGARQGVSV